MSDIKLDLEQVEQAVGQGPTAVPYPNTWLSDKLDAFLEVVGRIFSWSWILLMVLVVLNVILRYFFSNSYVALEELQWHIYSIGFMIGLSYCVLHDGHVRVDVLAEKLSHRKRALIEMLGLGLFLVPFCLFILFYAYPFVERAYVMGEVSGSPGGLPMRWLIKSVILIGFGLLLLAAVSRFVRAMSFLTGFPRARVAADR